MTVDFSVFDPAAVATDTAEYNDMVAELARTREWPPQSPAAYRAALRDRVAQLSGGATYRSGAATIKTIDDEPSPLSMRVFPKPDSRGTYLYFHGGGWCVGAADHQDAALEALGASTQMTVVSVEYRLAPEHPYPSGLNDAERAARWLLQFGAQEFGSERFVIGGDSAGANLALAALLRLRETGEHRGFVGANFLYGWYDATLTPSVSGEYRAGGALSKEMLEWFAERYLPDGVDRTQPFVSPLRARLEDLPPIFLTVGTRDPLLDDSLFLYARLRAANVPVDIQVLPGGGHAFDIAPIDIADQAKAQISSFLTNGLGGRR